MPFPQPANQGEKVLTLSQKGPQFVVAHDVIGQKTAVLVKQDDSQRQINAALVVITGELSQARPGMTMWLAKGLTDLP